MYTKEIEQFGNAVIFDTEPAVTAHSTIYDQKVVEAAINFPKKRNLLK